MRRTSMLLLPLLLAGCMAAPAALPPAPPQAACAPGASAASVAELYFGRNIGDRLGVTEKQWQRFLDTEVTPRFPDGLSVMDAGGQWRDTDTGRVVREPSKLLVLVLTDADAARPKLAAISDAYKREFQQQAVMTVVRPACVSF